MDFLQVAGAGRRKDERDPHDPMETGSLHKRFAREAADRADAALCRKPSCNPARGRLAVCPRPAGQGQSWWSGSGVNTCSAGADARRSLPSEQRPGGRARTSGRGSSAGQDAYTRRSKTIFRRNSMSRPNAGSMPRRLIAHAALDTNLSHTYPNDVFCIFALLASNTTSILFMNSERGIAPDPDRMRI